MLQTYFWELYFLYTSSLFFMFHNVLLKGQVVHRKQTMMRIE